MKRCFDFSDAKSFRFWQVNVSGENISVRCRELGADGQSAGKELARSGEAGARADKLIWKKVKKGYGQGGAKPGYEQKKKLISTAPQMGNSAKAFMLERERQKCGTQGEYWKKSGLVVERSQLWRFCQIVIETASESEIKKPLKNRDEQDRVCINHLFSELIDQTFEHCLSDDLDLPANKPGKEVQKLEKWFRKHSDRMFEKEGWSIEEIKLYFESDIKITVEKSQAVISSQFVPSNIRM
jgi:predicted DNA-binding WGR domain protein